MAKVASVEFQRKVEEYQNQAQREPIEISREGRGDLVLMSAEHYDWLRAAAQRKHHTSDAMDAIIDAVERAEMGSEHEALDHLLK